MSTPELTVLPQRKSAAPPGPPADHLRAVRRVKQLSWLSLVWMGAEGAVAIVAGVMAGSIALVGFGIDSAIEGLASAVIVWRFTGSRIHSPAAEQRAQKLVAAQFFLLAPYVAFEAVHRLITGERPDVSWLGMALATTSLIGMPLLGLAKVRLAHQLGSPATRGEGNQNLLCAYLAGAVLVGLAGQRRIRALVARPGGSARDRRGRGARRPRDLAWRGLLRRPRTVARGRPVPGRLLRPGDAGLVRAAVESGCQFTNPSVDVVTDRSHLVDRQPLGVLEVPVDVPPAGDVRAFVAAPHGHDHVGLFGQLAVERPRCAVGEVDVDLVHHLDDLRMDALRRRGARGRRGVTSLRGPFEERLAHL